MGDTTTRLRAINFDRYLRLADPGGSLRAAVFDLAGERVWGVAPVDAGSGFYERHLNAWGGQPVGTLVVAGGVLDAEHRADALADCLTHELQLSCELDAMARELGSRQDELNLAFADDAVPAGSRAADGTARLQHTLTRAVATLDVDGAFAVFGRLGLSLHSKRPGLPVFDPDGLAARLATLVAGPHLPGLAPVVLNSAGDRARVERLGYRAVVAPIVFGAGIAHGAVGVLRTPEGQVFTNSDARLVGLLARRAARLLAADCDALTGLFSRTAFETRAAVRIDGAGDGRGYCVLTLDLDQLSLVNEMNGRVAGDELIVLAAQHLCAQAPANCMFGRLGGNTFGVMLEASSLDAGMAAAEALRRRCERAMGAATGRPQTFSVGVAAVAGGGIGTAEAMGAAELALRAARKSGRNQVRGYAPEHRELQRHRDDMQWLARIRAALDEDRFELHAQPIAGSENGAPLMHFEILVRMRDGERLIAPFAFLPAAERFHLMPAIDTWVCEHTLATLTEHWPQLEPVALPWAINLSGQSLCNERFARQLLQRLDSCAVPSRFFGFEITETAAIAEVEVARDFIGALRRRGCRIYLDDFGTGLSTFEYLKRLEVDALKIDGVFVRDMLENPASEAMVRSINHVATVMHIDTIAEFVETDELRRRLAAIGINQVQGYGIGRPAPLELQIERLVAAAGGRALTA